MIKIICRNDDELRLTFLYNRPEELVKDFDFGEDPPGDNEVLLVVEDNFVIYSSLGNKASSYEDTVRYDEVVDWFR